ncbi:hypothetical protein K788_0009197 [Paraburkholderia caribensis MBA4]|uniref:Uncharacterized protein n=1 Tax=Paraburkholderia caribensis MBA4 TaxID=1323664 RepID=A0A0P0RI43_9BURK|nr:hypothetical protein K788_0009197 [Paraburkholderia caribensis MBA4]
MNSNDDTFESWQSSRILLSAIGLADSGRCCDISDIAYALRFELGCMDALERLDAAELRLFLNSRCSAARERAASNEANANNGTSPPYFVEALASQTPKGSLLFSLSGASISFRHFARTICRYLTLIAVRANVHRKRAAF